MDTWMVKNVCLIEQGNDSIRIDMKYEVDTSATKARPDTIFHYIKELYDD